MHVLFGALKTWPLFNDIRMLGSAKILFNMTEESDSRLQGKLTTLEQLKGHVYIKNNKINKHMLNNSIIEFMI